MAERCCRSCRSSFPDICHAKTCLCHLEQAALAREQDKRGTAPRRDPTANQAIGNVEKERRSREGERWPRTSGRSSA